METKNKEQAMPCQRRGVPPADTFIGVHTNISFTAANQYPQINRIRLDLVLLAWV